VTTAIAASIAPSDYQGGAQHTHGKCQNQADLIHTHHRQPRLVLTYASSVGMVWPLFKQATARPIDANGRSAIVAGPSDPLSRNPRPETGVYDGFWDCWASGSIGQFDGHGKARMKGPEAMGCLG
jgi:hypothetical protein